MRIFKKRQFHVPALLAALVLVLLGWFQNCSKVGFQPGSSVSQSSNTTTQSIQVKDYEVVVGTQETFPPLKLFFVVDNSATMFANQINLSKAFSRLFDGQNSTNISAFDTTVYMINTSQMSYDRGAAVFPRLPTMGLSDLGTSSYSNLVGLHRGSYLDGQIPGDLVGYQVLATNQGTSSLRQTSFVPFPVLGLSDNGQNGTQVSLGIHKGPSDSVDALKSDWNSRLALMNPNLSAIDPKTNQGVLDDVVNNESGLCALSRILRHHDSYVNPGDLAAFVLVSDEDDNDPTGANCVDSYKDTQGNVDLVDGQCSQPWTSLSYNQAVANPALPKCQVSYNSGFSYHYVYAQPRTNVNYFTSSQSYNVPQTVISYFTSVQTYSQPRTDISYYTSTQSYDTPQTLINYFTSHQEYDVPYTAVQYFTSSQEYDLATTDIGYFTSKNVCQNRDGAQINCQVQYTANTLSSVVGDYRLTSCSSFVAGKLPAGALTSDPNHLPTCSAGALQHQMGTCSASDSTKLNCVTKYQSATLASPIQGNAQGADCATFSAGKLPASVVSKDPSHPIVCTAAPSVHKSGACSVTDATVANCQTIYTSNALPAVSGNYQLATSCQAFATATGNLPSSALLNDSAHPVSCALGTAIHTANGTCSVSDPSVQNCVTTFTKVTLANQTGDYSNLGCAAYAKGKIPAAAVAGDSAHPVSCVAAAAGPKSGTGTCSTTDPSISNCQTSYPVKTVTVDGNSALSSCASFVVGKIPSGGLTNDPNHVPTCAPAATPRHVVGSCSTTNAAIQDCTTTFASQTLTNLTGDFSTAGCAAFVAGKLPSGAVLGDATHPISCSAASPLSVAIDGSESFSNALWANYTPVAGAACSADLVNSISMSKSVPAATTCTISSLATGNYTYEGATCASANPINYCTSSTGLRRDCTSVDVPAGAPYDAVLTTVQVKGQITCATACSATSFCATKAGSVGDNYHNCSVQSAPSTVDHTFTAATSGDPGICAAGLNAVVTKGPYRSVSEVTDYVAGQGSASRSPNALASYIQSQVHSVLSDALAISSIFVMQQSAGDVLGQAESYGTAYNFFADLMGGAKHSVKDADYSSSLENLSQVIHSRLARSFAIPGALPGQKVYHVWYRAANSSSWGQPLSQDLWTSAGGTVTILSGLDFQYGDQFRFEYY